MRVYHNTDAFVLWYRNRGDNDRVFGLYTLDFGLVVASAMGVRKESSKNRGVLQLGNRVNVDLLKLKSGGWRICSVGEGSSHGPEVVGYISRLGHYLKSLVVHEESNRRIFDIFVKISDDFDEGELKGFHFYLAELFDILGYMPDDVDKTDKDAVMGVVDSVLL